MNPPSPELKRALRAYEVARLHGAPREVLSALWAGVMKAQHGTPEPPVGLYGEAATIGFFGEPSKMKEDSGHIRRSPQSIDDFYDECRRENGR